jgi:hypothetical protein
LAELSEDVSRKTEENKKLAQEIEILQQRIKSGAALNGVATNGAPAGKNVQQQFAEFEVMKKSLMRDLQNRCERVTIVHFHVDNRPCTNKLSKVVELEISLDETREQYNNVLRTSNNRAQQKKMAFLERNLEQLTVVQRQLVEQNSQLKKEAAIAERKLATRTERIRNLESLLHDSQEKLTAASHRFVYTPSLTPESPVSSPASSVSSMPSSDKMLKQRKRSSNLRDLYEDGRRAMQYAVKSYHQHEQKWPYWPEMKGQQVENGLWTNIPTPPSRNFSRPFSKEQLLDRIDKFENSNITTQAQQAPTSHRAQAANTNTKSRFEVQLQSVKERLEAAKAGSTRGLGMGGGPGAGAFNFGVGPRIAKPLRGGGGGGEVQHPDVMTLQTTERPDVGGKRSSWFFNQRA